MTVPCAEDRHPEASPWGLASSALPMLTARCLQPDPVAVTGRTATRWRILGLKPNSPLSSHITAPAKRFLRVTFSSNTQPCGLASPAGCPRFPAGPGLQPRPEVRTGVTRGSPRMEEPPPRVLPPLHGGKSALEGLTLAPKLTVSFWLTALGQNHPATGQEVELQPVTKCHS